MTLVVPRPPFGGQNEASSLEQQGSNGLDFRVRKPQRAAGCIEGAHLHRQALFFSPAVTAIQARRVPRWHGGCSCGSFRHGYRPL